MADKQLDWSMIIQKFDEFEESFQKDPSDESLLEFFDVFGRAINDGKYEVDQLKTIKERMVKLKDLFAQTRIELDEKTNQAFERKKNVSQYIKTSQINRKS